ncbi:MAG: hypothetical protein AB8G18_03905 [Gammaproteobacteria bacterium]
MTNTVSNIRNQTGSLCKTSCYLYPEATCHDTHPVFVNTPDFSYNFFRLDDWFIRIGVVWFGVCVVMFLTNQFPFSFANPLFYAIIMPPVLIWFIGLRVRKTEKRTQSVWRILYSNTSVKVPELLDNSDISRNQLQDAVKLLNNRGLGFYVWNKKTDTITDGRLDDEYVMVDSCESCAAPVGLRVSLAGTEVPSCSYCQSPVASGQLNLLKQATIAELRGYEPAERRYGLPVRRGKRPFSIFLFVFLLIFCWPLAVFYGLYKTRSQRRNRW